MRNPSRLLSIANKRTEQEEARLPKISHPSQSFWRYLFVLEVRVRLSLNYKNHLTASVSVNTISGMEITYDPAKDKINITKHGVSLGSAAEFEWDEAVIWPDQRHEYGECREIGIGYIGNRLFNIVFVNRDAERRIISLRKANPREVKRYAQT